MNRALELIVAAGEEGQLVLRSPEVGWLTDVTPPGQLLAPGARAGSLIVLGRCHPLLVPAGARGRVVGEAPERVHEPVGYGQELLRLAPLASTDEPLSETGAVPDSAVDGLVFACPMAGRVWLRPRPEAPPFVQVGSELSAGAALALIEVMKTFTRAHYAAGGAQALPERARVVRILVEDGAEVEEGTPLFALE